MKYLLYNPEDKIIFVSSHKWPPYALNKLRRDCYRKLNFHTNNGKAISSCILLHGGISKIKFIMSDSIPFSYTTNFQSYKNNKFIEEWLKSHPGKNVIPIITAEEYDRATINRHTWDTLPDMYPNG